MYDVKGRLEKCTTKECGNRSTPKSYWCKNCRLSLRRWIHMNDAQKSASWDRAWLRWARVQAFRWRRGRRLVSPKKIKE